MFLVFKKDSVPSLSEMREEFDFYSLFELENQGFYKTEEYLNNKYEGREECKNLV